MYESKAVYEEDGYDFMEAFEHTQEEINKAEADQKGIKFGDWVEVESSVGKVRKVN